MTRRTLTHVMLGYIVAVMLACIICTGISSCGGPRTDPGGAATAQAQATADEGAALFHAQLTAIATEGR